MNTMHTWIRMGRAVTVAITFVMLGLSARAEQGTGAVALRAAIERETLTGNVREAMVAYQTLANSPDRAVAAEAMLWLAHAYELTGDADRARGVLDRIVQQFTGSPVAVEARARRSALEPPRVQRDALDPRKIASVAAPTGFAFTALGDRVVTNAGRDLVIRDLNSGQQTTLVAATPTHRAIQAAISRDGRSVAYVWVASTGVGVNIVDTNFELYVIDTDAGAKARLILPSLSGGPVGWSPDGQRVLIRELSNGAESLSWVSVVDRSMDPVRPLGDPRGRAALELSPDGKFVTYSATHAKNEPLPTAGGTVANRRLFVANLETSEEVEIVETVGSHFSPVWTPDGSHVLYVSERFGERGLWAVPVQAGRPTGTPILIKQRFQLDPVAVSHGGVLFCQDFESEGTKTYIVERGVFAGRPVMSFSGAGGDWSPDGRFFAFKPAIGNGDEVVVRNMETGAERSYRHERIAAASPHWLGNTGFLVNIGADANGANGGVYVCDVATGVFRQVYGRDGDFQRRSYTTPADGTRIYTLSRKAAPGEPYTALVGVDPSTGETVSTAPFPVTFPNQVAGVSVSRDGTAVVVMAKPDPAVPVARLLVMNTDGTGYRQLGDPFAAPSMPMENLVRFTPDGRDILYSTTIDGKTRIMRIPAAGGVPQLEGVEIDGVIYNFDPSPDGTRLAFSSRALPTSNIWAVDNILVALAGR